MSSRRFKVVTQVVTRQGVTTFTDDARRRHHSRHHFRDDRTPTECLVVTTSPVLPEALHVNHFNILMD